MSRVFWRLYAALTATVLTIMVAIAAGPAIEGQFFPVRGPVQAIEVIERTNTRICWAWTFTKRRTVGSDNVAAFLDVNGESGGVVSVFGMETGRPWGMTRYAVPPRAEPYTIRMCTALPPYVGPGDDVRVRQTAFYPGWLGLWRLSVPFPDVVSAGAKAP